MEWEKKKITRIHSELADFQEKGDSLFLTSSLQTHSLPLVHIVHEFDSMIPIYFIDTGYHFPETVKFKNYLKKEYNFNINEIRSDVSRLNQKDSSGNLLYASDPDYCCYINKVKPLEPILKEKDVWISGVRKTQTEYRANLDRVKTGKFETLHYHPILEWTSKMVYDYRIKHNLPEHPLSEYGYLSIGCMPCTRKMDLHNDDDRDGRWSGLNKSECGIHTETV